MYYGIYHPYGKSVLNRNGTQATKVHRFPSRRERDGWAWNDPGRCEAVKASHPLVRKAKRLIEQMYSEWRGSDWPIAVHE